MSNPSNIVVKVSRQMPFSAERVFDAWLDAKFAAKWLFATATGQMVRAEIDPRVGGRFTFVDRRDGEDVEHTGEYLEIQRPTRIVFTFGVPKYSPEFDRVTVTIAPKGPSACELTVTNEMKPELGEWARGTESGWASIVENLAATLGDKVAATNVAPVQAVAPGEARLVRLLPGPIERVWDYLVDGEKRKKWLAGGPIEQRVGGSVELHFRHADIAPNEQPPDEYKKYHDPGATMRGQVTRCEPPRLLSYTWGGIEVADNSEVTFELTPQDDMVQLVLTHRRLPDRDETIGVSAGWHTHAAILIALLSGTTPVPFWATHTRLKAEYAKLIPN